MPIYYIHKKTTNKGEKTMENYLNYQQRCIKRAKREKEEVENAKLLVDGILISLSFFGMIATMVILNLMFTEILY